MSAIFSTEVVKLNVNAETFNPLFECVKKTDCNMCIYLAVENKDFLYSKKKEEDL